VSCESCHGPASKDHPDTVKKLLPVSSETCQGCHSVTYGEWRISSHGQKNIRCFDCHKMHLMHLRKDDPDQMCGTCHTERLKDFSHATHHLKGVQCINCHMPEVIGAGLKIKGTGTRGHSFGVGAETCANCHREMVHARRDHLDMEAEIERLKGITSPVLQQQVKELRQEIDQQRVTLQANRRVFCMIVALAFCLGRGPRLRGRALPARKAQEGGAAEMSDLLSKLDARKFSRRQFLGGGAAAAGLALLAGRTALGRRAGIGAAANAGSESQSGALVDLTRCVGCRRLRKCLPRCARDGRLCRRNGLDTARARDGFPSPPGRSWISGKPTGRRRSRPYSR